jgi:phenylpropionate dioxygenase-like ring-hydroxylating dioxygenase large terminal subunit
MAGRPNGISASSGNSNRRRPAPIRARAIPLKEGEMRFTDDYPELGTGPVPIDSLISRAFFERERDNLFKQVWLKVGRVEEIANPGDYKVKQLAFAHTAAIIVRGKDSAIRAFHNICPHRGNKLIPEGGNETFGRARADTLNCRFHGWIFQTDGAIRAVPHEDKFKDFDRSCYGLIPIHCDVWEGFIFICLAETPRQTLSDYLGGMGDHFAGYPYGDATQSFRYSSALKCNWKVALYAFTEGYHVETIHAATFPSLAALQHVEFKLYGPHSTSTLYVPSVDGAKPTPATGLFGEVLHGSPRHAPHLDLLPKAINPTRRNDFQFEFPTFFPNFLIHLAANNGYPGMSYFTHQFWPISVDETLWEGVNYFRPPETLAEMAAIAHVNCLHRNAWLEDTGTMEDTQAALRSGVLPEMVLMDEELMIRNTDHHVRKYAAEGV